VRASLGAMDVGTRSGRPGRLIGVVGACGGAGSSTLAAAVAHALRRVGEPAVLVDLDVPGAGVDVLLGVEEEPGARWPELASARGDVDGGGLLAALPRWRSVPVLSGSRARPEPPDDAVVVDVCTGLLRAGEAAVLDLPRPGAWSAGTRTLVAACDVALLVAPLTVPGAAGAAVAIASLTDAGARDVRVVARQPAPGRVDAAGLRRAAARQVVATVRWDPRLTGAVERGEGPDVGRRSVLGRCAADVVAAL
jgi:secretion/DNA translocation related CpaE-like protein